MYIQWLDKATILIFKLNSRHTCDKEYIHRGKNCGILSKCAWEFMFYKVVPGILDPGSHRLWGSDYDHGWKMIFFDRFFAVSLHISIEIYIRTFHSKGFVSSFKTLALRAFQKSSRKARKSSNRKFIKGKSTKFDGPRTSDGRQTRPRPARALIFFLKGRWWTYIKSQ